MKVYILNYDQDTGAREEWNTFYTPCEVFSTEELRAARIAVLKIAVDEDGEPLDYEFHTYETTVDENV